MRRLVPLIAVALLAAIGLGAPAGAGAADGRTLHVPAGFPGVAEAIAASQPGDVILLAAGTYPGEIVVPEEKPGITIRGIDRNAVVFDGADSRANAIEVEADGVTLENMAAHSYLENGFYWDGVDGYAGRYLTVWNVGLYGIYAIESRGGVMEHSYVSGAADAAFYVGECYPCDAVLRNLTATLSAVGYSGTNAGGNLVLEDSLFENNATGILPNSYEVGLEPPPQREAVFRRNVVRGSGSVPTPRQTPLGGFYGIGIGIAGGVDNQIEANQVSGSTRYGIAVFGTVDRTTTWLPSGNRVTGNTVSTSGTADLALAEGSGPGNCFEGNAASLVEPPDMAAPCSADGEGSAAVMDELVQPPPALSVDLPDAPAYSDMPAPAPQPTMPIPESGIGLVVALAGAIVAIAGVMLLVVGLMGRARQPGRRLWRQVIPVGAAIAVLGGLAMIVAVGLLLTRSGGPAPGPSGAPLGGPATIAPSTGPPGTDAPGTSPTGPPGSLPADAPPFAGGPLTGVFDSCLPACDLYLVATDGGERVNLTQTDREQEESEPSLSPDGSQVAFRCAPPGAEPGRPHEPPLEQFLGAICVVTVADRSMTPVLEAAAVDYGSPAWSPDGQTIAFAFTNVVDGSGGIGLMSPTGGEVRTILEDESAVANPAWSPDGRTIAYSCGKGSPDGGPDVLQLCALSVDGTDRRELAPIDGTCGGPAFSPDGFVVAAVCMPPDGADGDLYQVSVGEGQAVPVTRDGRIAPEGQARPAWSADGRHVFVRMDDALWAIDVVERTWSLTSLPALHGDFVLGPPTN